MYNTRQTTHDFSLTCSSRQASKVSKTYPPPSRMNVQPMLCAQCRMNTLWERCRFQRVGITSRDTQSLHCTLRTERAFPRTVNVSGLFPHRSKELPFATEAPRGLQPRSVLTAPNDTPIQPSAQPSVSWQTDTNRALFVLKANEGQTECLTPGAQKAQRESQSMRKATCASAQNQRKPHSRREILPRQQTCYDSERYAFLSSGLDFFLLPLTFSCGPYVKGSTPPVGSVQSGFGKSQCFLPPV